MASLKMVLSAYVYSPMSSYNYLASVKNIDNIYYTQHQVHSTATFLIVNIDLIKKLYKFSAEDRC